MAYVNNKCIKGKKCSGCANCCTEYIPWTEKEILAVKEYLKQHPEVTEQHGDITKDDLDVICAFNDEKTKRCLIYEVRPEICRCFKCNQMSSTIDKNKNTLMSKAVVNNLNPLNKFNGMGNLCSTHSMFFGNKQYDAEFIKRFALLVHKYRGEKPEDVYNELSNFYVILEDDSNEKM